MIPQALRHFLRVYVKDPPMVTKRRAPFPQSGFVPPGAGEGDEGVRDVEAGQMEVFV